MSAVLRPGDVVYEVDGVNVYGKSISFVFNLVKVRGGRKQGELLTPSAGQTWDESRPDVQEIRRRDGEGRGAIDLCAGQNDDNPYDQEYIRTTLTRRVILLAHPPSVSSHLLLQARAEGSQKPRRVKW